MKQAENSGDNIAEFWQTHFKESQKVATKISTYEFFTKTEHYRDEDYQTFTARSGRMIRSTKNKNTKNKLYKIEPRSHKAIMFFQQSSINTPGRSIGETDKIEEVEERKGETRHIQPSIISSPKETKGTRTTPATSQPDNVLVGLSPQVKPNPEQLTIEAGQPSIPSLSELEININKVTSEIPISTNNEISCNKLCADDTVALEYPDSNLILTLSLINKESEFLLLKSASIDRTWRT